MPSANSPVGDYPQPVPVFTGTPIAHEPNDPFSVLLVVHESEPDKLVLSRSNL